VERAEHPLRIEDRAGRIGRKEGTARRGIAERTSRRGRWADKAGEEEWKGQAREKGGQTRKEWATR
jgi:hypothetical protein